MRRHLYHPHILTEVSFSTGAVLGLFIGCTLALLNAMLKVYISRDLRF